MIIMKPNITSLREQLVGENYHTKHKIEEICSRNSIWEIGVFFGLIQPNLTMKHPLAEKNVVNTKATN